MTRYKVEWSENKVGASGKTYTIVSLTAEDGTKIEKASTFDKVETGKDYEGEVVANGQYLNFKVAPTPGIMGTKPAWTAKTDKIKEAQIRKEGMIEKAMDKKEEAIAYFNSCNLALQALGANFEEEAFKSLRNFFFREWYNFKVEDVIDPTN